jgi:biopolymer transport protein ExbD
MRVPTASRTTGVGFNMTPMIDIVFLLIVFFLVSSHLASREVQVDLRLPEATSGDDPATDLPPRVTINVLAEGTLRLAGTDLDVDQLGQRLRVEAARTERDIEVRIRSDRTVPYRYIEPVLVACARAGIWNVSFAVIRRES